MRALPLVLSLVIVGTAALEAQDQHQHEHSTAPPQQLGRVHFETSCDPALRADVDRAVALLHLSLIHI